MESRVNRESTAKLELVNSVFAGSTYKYTEDERYIDYDVVYGEETEVASVRAINCVFGSVMMNSGVAPSDCYECEVAWKDNPWLKDASTATNVLTRLTMSAHLPYEAGSAANKGWNVYHDEEWSNITCGTNGIQIVTVRGAGWAWIPVDRDMLGYERSDSYRAVGAVAADPAARTDSPFIAWALSQGLTGEDAAWDAKPAKWGGKWANAFIYTFGEGLADGTLAIMSITFDSNGMPIITTTPVVEGHTGFTPAVIGTPNLIDWASPVVVENSGNTWSLPAEASANFFRVRLSN